MKKFILTAIIFTLSLSVIFLFSCTDDSQTPTTHVECSDADNDGKCDVCNEILYKEPAVCDCIDENLDGKCDLCDGRISAAVSFFENGKTDFKIVHSSSLSGTEMKILDDLI